MLSVSYLFLDTSCDWIPNLLLYSVLYNNFYFSNLWFLHFHSQAEVSLRNSHLDWCPNSYDSSCHLPIKLLESCTHGFQGDTVVKKIYMLMQETQKSWVWSLGWEDPWRRKWQPTPVFLPGKFHEQSNLASYNPWDHKESGTTEHTILVPVAFNTCTPDTTVLTKVWYYSSEFIWW